MLRSLSIALALALLGLPTAAQTPSDPFAPGQRWSAGPDPAQPWIPRDVSFAAGGELVWAGAAQGDPHLELYAAGATLDAQAPLHRGPSLAGAIGLVPVAAGSGAGELFAAAQFPQPTATHRRTEVYRYDALAAAAGAPFTPVWTRTLPVLSDGQALLAADGSGGLVVATHEPSNDVHLEWLSAHSGAPLASTKVPGGSLTGLAISQGATRVALTAGTDLWVVDTAGVLHHETMTSASGCLALSADGRLLVIGNLGSARVLEDTGGGYTPILTLQRGPTEVAVSGALAPDGAAVAVGFWDFQTGTDVHLETRALPGGAVLHSLTWSGPGLQNYPQALTFNADGRRLALGLWGQGGAEPEVVLLATQQPAPLHAWDLPGSALALDLDPSGTRVAACVKDGHANQFSTTGTVRLLGSGEQDLQVTGPVRVGGSLDLAFLRSGIAAAVFGVGTPSAVAHQIDGVAGLLWLAPGQPVLFYPAPADAQGRAQASLGVPASPALIGADLGVQAAGIAGGTIGLSKVMARPVVL